MALVISNLSFKLSANAAALKKDFEAAGSSVKNLGGAAERAGGDFGSFGKQATDVAFSLNQIEEAAGRVWQRLKDLAQPARDFGAAMAASTAIMKGVTEEIRGDMVKAAEQAAFATQFSMTQAAQSYRFLAAAGLDAKRSIAAMPVVANFAQAGLFDLALATDILTDAQSAMGLASKDAAKNMEGLIRTGDALVQANQIANASVEQFGEALTSGAGSMGRTFDQSIEQVLAVLAAYAAQGTKGADASTQYSIALRDLTTKALENKQAFADAGVAVFDASGKVRFMGDIIADLEKRLGPMSTEMKRAELTALGFSNKSVGALLKLIGTSDSIRNDYLPALMEAEGVMDRVSKITLSEFDQAMAAATAAMESLKIAIFTPILNAFGRAINYVIEVLRGLHGAAAQNVVKMTVFVGVFTTALLVLPKVIAAMRAMAVVAWTVATAKTAAAAASMNFAAVAAALAIAAGGVFATHKAMQHLDADIAETIAKGDELAEALSAPTEALDEMGEAAEEAGETAKKAATDWESIGKRITDSVKTPMEQYRDQVDEIIGAVAHGAITWETFNRAASEAVATLQEATRAKQDFNANTQGVGAAVAGTTAGFSAVQGAKREEAERLRLEKQAAAERKKTNELLDAIRREAKEKIEIKEARL